MIDIQTVKAIYITAGYTDLRMGIDGYATKVEQEYKKSPFNNAIYIFCNKQRDKLKILHFEYDGFWLYYKRIETGHIKWPNKKEITLIDERQFRWLFEGLKINQKALKKCEATRIS